LLFSKLRADKVTPDALFNICSGYGNVNMIKILRTKPDHALVEMADADAAAADLVITCGGAGVERKVRELAPSAVAVADLWEFAQFARRAELDGTGVAAIVQRSLARGVVAPCIEEAMKLRAGDDWGLDTAGGAGKDALEVARARVVIGVAGLVTFLLAISPLEEVERVTKR